MNFIKSLFVFFLLVFSSIEIYSRGSAGENASFESIRIVDMPTAGVIPKNTYVVNSFIMDNGGMVTEFSVSPFENFMIGLSYGGNGIIGTGKPVFQGLPGLNLKYRLLNETEERPAIALGINTQGKGIYFEDDNRYINLSPGLYAALSKSFKWSLGVVAIHGGINYSFEPKINDRTINLYAGAEQTIFSSLSLMLELNFNFNEVEKYYGQGKSLIHTEIRWAAAESVTISLQFRDLLSNMSYTNSLVRFLSVEYIAYF